MASRNPQLHPTTIRNSRGVILGSTSLLHQGACQGGVPSKEHAKVHRVPHFASACVCGRAFAFTLCDFIYRRYAWARAPTEPFIDLFCGHLSRHPTAPLSGEIDLRERQGGNTAVSLRRFLSLCFSSFFFVFGFCLIPRQRGSVRRRWMLVSPLLFGCFVAADVSFSDALFRVWAPRCSGLVVTGLLRVWRPRQWTFLSIVSGSPWRVTAYLCCMPIRNPRGRSNARVIIWALPLCSVY